MKAETVASPLPGIALCAESVIARPGAQRKISATSPEKKSGTAGLETHSEVKDFPDSLCFYPSSSLPFEYQDF